MSDRLFLTLMAATSIAMIALASVWPQGLGARSPGPFGHTPLQQTPAMRAIMAREAAKAQAHHQTQINAAAAQLRRTAQPPGAPPASAAPAKPAAPAGAAPAGLRPDQ
jgi:hypothetical protein